MDEKLKPKRKRSHEVRICFNDEEYAKFMEKLEVSGLTRQQFVIDTVLDKEIRSTDYGPEIMHELARIGNNLNRVIKNFYVADASAEEVMAAVKKCRVTIDLIYETTKKGGI